jgi:hypothetical protein
MLGWLRNPSLYASIACGARDTADFLRFAAIDRASKKAIRSN